MVTVDGMNIVESLTATSGLNVADEAVVCPFLKGAYINSELLCCDGGLDIWHTWIHPVHFLKRKTDSVQKTNMSTFVQF